MNKTEAILAGEAEAHKMSEAGWRLAGLIVPILANLIVHLRSPRVPPGVLAIHDDSATLRYFETQFADTLKARQVKAAWVGALIGIGVAMLLFAHMLANA